MLFNLYMHKVSVDETVKNAPRHVNQSIARYTLWQKKGGQLINTPS